MKLFSFILDLLFPRAPLIREIESMDAYTFAFRVEKTDGYAGKNIISLFSYRDPLVRQAIWELKYRGNKRIAKLLSETLYDELLAFLEEYAPLTNFTEPLLIPVPLSRKRESERGFNQCRLLADELMRLDSPFVKGSTRRLRREGFSSPILPNKGGVAVFGDGGCYQGGAGGGRNFTLCLHGLRKIKDTASQTKQDTRKKRLENLDGCFEADSAAIEGRNIILIDDVATIGATIEEARRALKSAGAKKVIAFTIAH